MKKIKRGKKKKGNDALIKVGIACYSSDQWERFRQIIDDPEEVSETWEEWNIQIQELEQTLKAQGLEFAEINIDLDLLQKYCEDNNLKNNAQTRSQYTSELLRRRDQNNE